MENSKNCRILKNQIVLCGYHKINGFETISCSCVYLNK